MQHFLGLSGDDSDSLIFLLKRVEFRLGAFFLPFGFYLLAFERLFAGFLKMVML